MHVVVVESPAKAKTINKYLGKDYIVLASYGHVRDLPPKDGSVNPDDDFKMLWQVDATSKKQLKAITDALKGATDLWLATDPDREGEAISWHVEQILQEAGKLKNINVHRVVFHEITKDAILEAFHKPRKIDSEMVEAYLARRALDYLVGFNISPLLWRKLPGAKSAGRVQSVALRLICERESEIEDFKSDEYWTIKGLFNTQKNEDLTANLTYLQGKKLEKLSLKDAKDADKGEAALRSGLFTVSKVATKQTNRHPYAPFITSTLQQDASRKLSFSAKKTMQVAQKLYEGINIGGETVGLITYMRTDSVALSQDAISQSRGYIEKNYNKRYLPASPRSFKSKSRNAQEAHEAIRPTLIAREPKQLSQSLDKDQYRLYELIWKRTVASQMASAVMDQMEVQISSSDEQTILKATGSAIAFDGFLSLYLEAGDDIDERNTLLPYVKEGETISLKDVQKEQHFTQPPARYSEASLVSKLEELGIGRPSTYASIISVLQDRDYVHLEKRRFIPEDRGRIVTAFMQKWFERYVQYDFTASLEEQLDFVAQGKDQWKDVLENFWKDFHANIDSLKDLTITEVVDAIDAELGTHFIGEDRECPKCKMGQLGLKVGRFGSFIGCSRYPDCDYTRPLTKISEEEAAAELNNNEPKELGIDPETNKIVHLKKGPYGWYVQLGEPEGKSKPKRASLGKDKNPDDITLEVALSMLVLPREVGVYPETGEMIVANIGRFGPYLNWGKSYLNLKQDDVYTIGLNRAVALIAESAALKEGKKIGHFAETGDDILLKSGRYGPYVEAGSLRASLPRGTDTSEVSEEQAINLLIEAKNKPAKTPKKATKKAAAKTKTTAKKATSKTKAKAKKTSES
ncbi:MAG: type I DNA topoisomerase [Alphaproteobacteria bacterium]